MRVLVVAPTMALRVGLAAMLQAVDPQISVSAQAGTTAEALALAEQADVVLLAGGPWRVSDLQRLETLKERVGLLLLSDEPEYASRLFEAWGGVAWGVLSSDASPEELAAALRAVQEGLVVGPERLLRRLMASPTLSMMGGPAMEGENELTAREREVLQRLAQGLANKQIGLALGISEHTVKFHVSAVYAKLGAANRTEAVRFGLQKGLISL